MISIKQLGANSIKSITVFTPGHNMYEPKPYDAVLGNNQVPNTPYNALVLGGIEGIKRRLSSDALLVKLEALSNALEYEGEGLQVIHQFMQQETEPCVKWVVSNWVWQKASETARVEFRRYKSCLKHINKELMESVLIAMSTNIKDSSVAPAQTILNRIENSCNHKIHQNNFLSRYKELAGLYYSHIDQGKIVNSYLKVVIIAYQEVIKHDKFSYWLPDVLNKQALAYYYLEDYEAAIQNASQAIQSSPYFAWAYNTRGIARSALGDKKGAVEDYNSAIKHSPGYAVAYYNRGNSYYDLGDNAAAIKDYSQTIKINPNYINAYYATGLAYSNLKDYEAAIKYFNQAITINPNDGNFYYDKGLAHYNLANYEAAIEAYNQAIKINPNYAYAYCGRGLAYYRLTNYQAAIKDYNECIFLNPNFAIGYYDRGLVYAVLGNQQAAITDYNQAIIINPSYADAYYNRGFAYHNLGDKQAAIQDYRQAANLYKQQGNETKYQDLLNRIFTLEY